MAVPTVQVNSVQNRIEEIFLPNSDATSNSVVTVKKEKVEDHEINQLAIEMAEKNRLKMISQAPQIQQQNQVSQQALQRAGGQQMITFYFQNSNNKDFVSDSLLPKKDEEKKKGTLDEESIKGRFGWTSLHQAHIPYIYRQDEKYCSVKIVETKLLNKYLSYLPNEITTCIHVRSYYITEVESKLFNEINVKHCEYQFGRELFTSKDLVVKLFDAKCFYKFLDTCYKKLVQKSPDQSEFCGFVRINGESVVPYTVKATVKFVPLFYFEGETDTLKLKAQKIEGWELAYLKFCCKVQGIRNELFASDTCYVVSLDDVKQYFPKDTLFEDWWPQKTAEPMRVINHGGKSGCNWTQRPTMPSNQTSNSQNNAIPSPAKSPVVQNTSNNTTSHKSQSRQSSMNSMNNLPNNYNNLYSQWATATSLMNGQAQAQAQLYNGYNNYPGMQNFLTQMNSDHLRRLGSTLAGNQASLMQGLAATNSQLGLRPPPLVRANASQAYSPIRQMPTNNNLDALRQLGYLSDQASANPMDVLLGSTGHHSTIQNSTMNNTTKSPQQKAPPPLIPVSNGVRADNISSHKGIGRNGIDKHKLLDVPIFRPDMGRGMVPYRVSKVSIGGKIVFSINFVAFCYTGDTMIAVQDVINEFLPTATLSECLNLFVEILKLQIYKANWHQVCALMDAWSGAVTTPDVVPLLKSSDLKDTLPQIKYIYQNQQSMSQPQSKKIRT